MCGRKTASKHEGRRTATLSVTSVQFFLRDIGNIHQCDSFTFPEEEKYVYDMQ